MKFGGRAKRPEKTNQNQDNFRGAFREQSLLPTSILRNPKIAGAGFEPRDLEVMGLTS